MSVKKCVKFIGSLFETYEKFLYLSPTVTPKGREWTTTLDESVGNNISLFLNDLEISLARADTTLSFSNKINAFHTIEKSDLYGTSQVPDFFITDFKDELYNTLSYTTPKELCPKVYDIFLSEEPISYWLSMHQPPQSYMTHYLLTQYKNLEPTKADCEIVFNALTNKNVVTDVLLLKATFFTFKDLITNRHHPEFIEGKEHEIINILNMGIPKNQWYNFVEFLPNLLEIESKNAVSLTDNLSQIMYINHPVLLDHYDHNISILQLRKGIEYLELIKSDSFPSIKRCHILECELDKTTVVVEYIKPSLNPTEQFNEVMHGLLDTYFQNNFHKLDLKNNPSLKDGIITTLNDYLGTLYQYQTMQEGLPKKSSSSIKKNKI